MTRHILRSGWALALILGLAPNPAAAQSLCDNPSASCGRMLTNDCRGRIGAGSLGAGGGSDACDAQLASYRECLAAAAETCGGGPTPSQNACSSDREARLWDAVKDSGDPSELEVFVETCPESPFATIARRRIASLQSSGGGGVQPIPERGFEPVTPARPIYQGVFAGRWFNPTFGTGGQAQMVVVAYDPASGAITMNSAIEEQGMITNGVMTGEVALDGSAVLSGPATMPGVGQWMITLRFNPPPAAMVSVLNGSYESAPVTGIGDVYTGVVQLQRVQ